jgi:DNA-directed RNA polymerase subunit omega
MLRPTDIESLKGDKSRYAIVIGVAKRARDIAEKAEQDGVILLEKPVSLAINDLTSGDYKILMSDNNEEEADEAEEVTEE